jgi:hypothetical protein
MIRGRLQAVVPSAAEGEDITRRNPHPNNVAYALEKYGRWLADTVTCFERNTDVVEVILGCGKKVVPAIYGDRTELTLRWNDGDDNGWKAWVEWVLDNADRWEGVHLGNIVLETTNYFCPHEPSASVVHRILDKFPTLKGKLVLGPFHDPDITTDLATDGFPLRAAMLEAGPWHNVYWGYELMASGSPNLHDWLSGVTCYSGVNYSTGAAAHNLTKLEQAGFAGGLFFLPVHDRRKTDERMEMYLTDVLKR